MRYYTQQPGTQSVLRKLQPPREVEGCPWASLHRFRRGETLVCSLHPMLRAALGLSIPVCWVGSSDHVPGARILSKNRPWICTRCTCCRPWPPCRLEVLPCVGEAQRSLRAGGPGHMTPILWMKVSWVPLLTHLSLGSCLLRPALLLPPALAWGGPGDSTLFLRN